MATWVIAGASGFLGINLGTWLGGRAYRVGLTREATRAVAEEVHIVDLSDPDAIAKVLTAVRADVVVNAAALASHEECERHPELAKQANVGVALALASATSRLGVRLIHISTDAVFNGGSGNYRETDDPDPFSVYGMTKLLGEEAVRSVNPEALIVRTNFFGWSPSGRRSILEFFVNSLTAGIRVQGFTDFTVTSIYVQHLTSVLFQLSELDFSGVLHVASANSLSKFDFGVAVAKEFVLDSSLIAPTVTSSSESRAQLSLAAQSRRGRDLSLNTQLIASLLGQDLPTQEAGIRAAHRDGVLRAEIRHYG